MQRPLQVYPRDPHPQKNSYPWTAAEIFNYEVLLSLLSEDPTKFRKELERLMTIHNPSWRKQDQTLTYPSYK